MKTKGLNTCDKVQGNIEVTRGAKICVTREGREDMRATSCHSNSETVVGQTLWPMFRYTYNALSLRGCLFTGQLFQCTGKQAANTFSLWKRLLRWDRTNIGQTEAHSELRKNAAVHCADDWHVQIIKLSRCRNSTCMYATSCHSNSETVVGQTLWPMFRCTYNALSLREMLHMSLGLGSLFFHTHVASRGSARPLISSKQIDLFY